MIEQTLIAQAAEIAKAGHKGWGNTMLDAAAELAALRKDAERWRRARRNAITLDDFSYYIDDEIEAFVDAQMAAAPAFGAA